MQSGVPLFCRDFAKKQAKQNEPQDVTRGCEDAIFLRWSSRWRHEQVCRCKIDVAMSQSTVDVISFIYAMLNLR